MNIVIVTGLLNYPLETGGDVVTFNLIKELSHRNKLVVMFPAYSNVEHTRVELQKMLPGVELIIFNQDKKHYSLADKISNRVNNTWTSLSNRLRSALNKASWEDEQHLKRTFYSNFGYINEVIKAKAAKGEVDLVQVEYPWMMGLVESLPAGLPKVYIAIELTFSMLAEKAATFTDAALKAMWTRRQEKVKAKEMELGSKYDAILTISDYDREVWQKALPAHSIVYSPSGIDTEYYKARKPIYKFDKVLFIGHGKHHANIDAADIFFKYIYPVVKEQVPGVQVVFTGEYDQAIKDRYPKDSNITWTGFVDDLRDCMDGAISIAPMRIGSGLRIKILESMAYGCPVVTTEIGREGIPVTDGKDILIRNEPEEFAEAIINLLKDQELAQKLSANARETIVRNFEQRNVVSAREAAFKAVIDSKKVGAN